MYLIRIILRTYSTGNGSSWNQSLQDGFYTAAASETLISGDQIPNINNSSALRDLSGSTAAGAFELVLYTKTALGDGTQANNPWLQELPDPITRTTWDNYLTISQKDAEKLGIENYNVANGALDGTYAIVKMDGVERKITCANSARSSCRNYWYRFRIW